MIKTDQFLKELADILERDPTQVTDLHIKNLKAVASYVDSLENDLEVARQKLRDLN